MTYNNIDSPNTNIFGKPDQGVGFLLWRASCKWRKEVESILRAFELTHPQYTVLSYLAWLTKNGAKVSQVEIAKHSNIDVATISQIIRHLEKRKLIKRKNIKGDDRAKYPLLTNEGISLITRTIPAIEFVDRAFFTPLSHEKLNFMMILTMLITDNS